jgi:outer membrane protein OmpA-like peptidoglycan-associated protein
MLWWLTLALAGPAYAQSTEVELNAQHFRPSVDGDHAIWTDPSAALPSGTGTARLLFSYTNRPFVYLPAGGAAPVALVSDALQADLLVGYTLGPVRLGADLPVYLLTAGEAGAGGAGVGDLALDLKGTLLQPEADGVGVALNGRMSFNTSSVDLPLGASGLGGELAAIVDYKVDALTVGLNLGARFNPTTELENVTLGDQLFARFGAGYAASEAVGLSLDFVGHGNFSAPLTNAAAIPVEAMLGGSVRTPQAFVVRAGLGTGLSKGIGAPLFRGVLSVGYEPKGPTRQDADGDGLADRVDQCVDQPEDLDQWQDEDGCPDPDNDADQRLDAADACPNEAEDLDGYEDEDGCPESATSVQVRVEDPNGGVIATARTSIIGTGVDHQDDGEFAVVLEPGLYSVEVDADRYVGADERFMVPVGEPFQVVITLQPDAPMGRLKIRVIQSDGTPIADATWFVAGREPQAVSDTEISIEPGSYEVQIRAPGYAPSVAIAEISDDTLSRVVAMLQPSRVEVTAERIDLKEKVFFDTGRATIKPESFALLDEVATVLNDHPEILKVRVEGHTDSRGSATYNLDLSTRRAASVRQYLIDKGVEPGRLESAGFGESRPIDPAENEAAWERNRRVEVFIVERAD